MATTTKSAADAAESLVAKIAWTGGFVRGLNEKSAELVKKATPERLQGLVGRLSPGQLPGVKGLSLSNPMIDKLTRSILQSTGAVGSKKTAASN